MFKIGDKVKYIGPPNDIVMLRKVGTICTVTNIRSWDDGNDTQYIECQTDETHMWVWCGEFQIFINYNEAWDEC